MKRLVLAALIFSAPVSFSSPLSARTLGSGYCAQSGAASVTSGASASRPSQTYPGATLNVYIHGGASGSVTTSGTTVTWSSGTAFNANSQWSGLRIAIKDRTFTIAGVSSPTSLTLTTSAGIQAKPVKYSVATAPAAIFSDYAGTAEPNPLICDSVTGSYSFFADDGSYDLRLSGPGIRVPFTLQAASAADPAGAAVLFDVTKYGAAGTGQGDDTAAIQKAGDAAIAQHGCLYFPLGTFPVSSVLLRAGPASVCLKLDPDATISRTDQALQAASHMFEITTTGTVSVEGGTFDMRGDASSKNSWYDALYVHGATPGIGPSQARFLNSAYNNSQNVGLQCSDCSNATISGLSVHHDYWFGVSFAGDGGPGGTGGTPVYTENFSASNITCDDTPIGLGVNFYIRNIAISNLDLKKCNLSMLQMPDAKAVVSHVTVSGSSTYGLGNGEEEGVFLEGVNGVALDHISVDGTAIYGIRCQGSKLQLLKGPTIALPCLNLKITDSRVSNNARDVAVLVVGPSFPGIISKCVNAAVAVCTADYAPATGQSITLEGFTGGWAALNGTFPATNITDTTFSVAVDSSGFGSFSAANPRWSIRGSNVQVSNNAIQSSMHGINVTGVDNTSVEGNQEENLKGGGDILSLDTNFRYAGNRLVNISLGSAGAHPAILTTMSNGVIQGNTILSTEGNRNGACWQDDTPPGKATQIQILPDNAFTNCAGVPPITQTPPGVAK